MPSAGRELFVSQSELQSPHAARSRLEFIMTHLKLPRRAFLQLAAGAAALPAVSHVAYAQAYPSRPVRWIIGFPAGGTVDISSRVVGQYLSEKLGQSFVIENRPGAAGSIAGEAVARAPADGYTLLSISPSHAINATLYNKPNFNFRRDIAPVASIGREPFVMTVNPSFPARTVPEFIAYAKTNPGKINMASTGTGAVTHVAGELFKVMTGVNMVHVPYRGGAPAVTDLLAGQVQIYFGAIGSSIAYIRTGKLRALAVTSASRSQALPDIPTVSESVPGYEATFWGGIGVPKNTPVGTIDRLNKAINAALADPGVTARLADFGNVPIAMTPSEFGNFVAAEIEKWAKVIRAANIKPI